MEEKLNIQTQNTYSQIRQTVISAQSKVMLAVNSAMVQAYWEIGEQIFIACDRNERAEYGKSLMKFLAEELTSEFGKGYSVRNLRNMRQFYLAFPIRQTLSAKLSWSHYTLLMHVENEERRKFYLNECEKASWSVRQLKRC